MAICNRVIHSANSDGVRAANSFTTSFLPLVTLPPPSVLAVLAVRPSSAAPGHKITSSWKRANRWAFWSVSRHVMEL